MNLGRWDFVGFLWHQTEQFKTQKKFERYVLPRPRVSTCEWETLVIVRDISTFGGGNYHPSSETAKDLVTRELCSSLDCGKCNVSATSFITSVPLLFSQKWALILAVYCSIVGNFIWVCGRLFSGYIGHDFSSVRIALFLRIQWAAIFHSHSRVCASNTARTGWVSPFNASKDMESTFAVPDMPNLSWTYNTSSVSHAGMSVPTFDPLWNGILIPKIVNASIKAKVFLAWEVLL